MKKKILSLQLLILLTILYAQEPLLVESPLPRGYRDLNFGDTFKEVEEKLLSDPLFLYRGQPDVSILDEPNVTLIECRGADYIQWGSFHFYEDKLYIITLELNPQQLDHFQIYKTLTQKYGEPSTLNPRISVWFTSETALRLERPLSVKYINNIVLEKIKEEGKANKAYEEIAKEDFLDMF